MTVARRSAAAPKRASGRGLVGKTGSGDYRSGHWSGKVVKEIKVGKTRATSEFAIRPDAKSRHPGEPKLIHRYGDKIRASR